MQIIDMDGEGQYVSTFGSMCGKGIRSLIMYGTDFESLSEVTDAQLRAWVNDRRVRFAQEADDPNNS